MFLHKSIHFPDAIVQMASNQGRFSILEKYQHKWEIVKTLIYVSSNGIQYPYYLDKFGKCVYYRMGIVNCDTIGEIEYTEEPINLI